ncbi:MAG: DNA-binding protein, partial [Flavisolibacter sp.]|nr:DNA-binding protein [Flavisolibacter sp.]
MAVEIVTREDLDKFRLQLLEDIKNLLQPSPTVAEKKWLRTPDVLEILKISLSTLQNLCYKRIL